MTYGSTRPRRRSRILAGLLIALAAVLLMIGGAWASGDPRLVGEGVLEGAITERARCGEWRAAPGHSQRAFSEGAADRLRVRAPDLGVSGDQLPAAGEIEDQLDAACAHGDRAVRDALGDFLFGRLPPG